MCSTGDAESTLSNQNLGGSRRGRPVHSGESGFYLWSPPKPGVVTNLRGEDCDACRLYKEPGHCASAAPHLEKDGEKMACLIFVNNSVKNK